MEGDYAGFTNKGNIGAISFSYSAERRTLFIGQNAPAMPRVGDELQFDRLLLPFEFSIAVQLSTGQFFKPSKTIFGFVEQHYFLCLTEGRRLSQDPVP